MSELEVFNSEKFGKGRTIVLRSEPWFVGKDVATCLGYTDISHTIIDHVDGEDRVNSKSQGQIDPEFGQRGTWLINESGLYSLIIGSKLPSAREFKHWVTHEVLPMIRKTGSYSAIAVPKTLPEALRAYADEVEAHEHTKETLSIAAPKAEVYDTLVSADHLIGFREMCKELKVKETVVRAILVSAGWLYKEGKHWIPYKTVIDKGYMEAKDFIGDTLTGVSYKYTMNGRDKVREMLFNE